MLWGGESQRPGSPEEPKGVADDPRSDPIIPPRVDPLLDEILRDKVLQYRCAQFVSYGFTIPQARRLAVERGVDLHFVRDRLIARGCDTNTAFDIAS